MFGIPIALGVCKRSMGDSAPRVQRAPLDAVDHSTKITTTLSATHTGNLLTVGFGNKTANLPRFYDTGPLLNG